MKNFMLSFIDESEAIEIVLIEVPKELSQRYIYGDTAKDVYIATFPNVYIKNLPEDVVNTSSLISLTAKEVLADNSLIKLSLEELVENITTNTPVDFFEKMQKLSKGYEALMSNLTDESYERLDTFINDFYEEVNLVKDDSVE